MKLFNQVRKYGSRAALAVGAGFASAVAVSAPAGPDYSAITDAITFDGVSDLVIGAAAALATIYVLIKGVKIAVGFVRS